MMVPTPVNLFKSLKFPAMDGDAGLGASGLRAREGPGNKGESPHLSPNIDQQGHAAVCSKDVGRP